MQRLIGHVLWEGMFLEEGKDSHAHYYRMTLIEGAPDARVPLQEINYGIDTD